MEETFEIDLRLGHVADLYYSLIHQKTPRQLDLLEEWFPGFVVLEKEGDKKTEPEYLDRECKICAYRYKGSLYAGGSSGRVSQILGRLTGTAKSNPEKERKAAELIRKNIASRIIKDPDATDILQEAADKHLDILTDEQLQQFHELLFEVIWDSSVDRYKKDPYDRMNEAFPMDDEVWDALIYNAGYQLHLFTYEGIVNAYLWLMLGGLLRNEVGRVVRMFHSGFSAVNMERSEDGTIIDKLNYLFFPEEYYSTYSGNDLDKRFPGVSWTCDRCGDILESQPGFDDHLAVWQCRKCGYLNPIDNSDIYANQEDRIHELPYTEKEIEDDRRALEARRKELENK